MKLTKNRSLRLCAVLVACLQLAAAEETQRDAARAKRGWRRVNRALTSHFNKSTHRRRLGETTTPTTPGPATAARRALHVARRTPRAGSLYTRSPMIQIST